MIYDGGLPEYWSLSPKGRGQVSPRRSDVDYIDFLAAGIVQVPVAQEEQASAFLGLQQAQLERARELTARARRVSDFMGLSGWGYLGMVTACLPPAMGGSVEVLIYSRKFTSAKAEVWRASLPHPASTGLPS